MKSVIIWNIIWGLRTTDCVGIILFGTEMREEMVRPFLKLPFPVVILDAYFENLNCNYVVPNNRQGAYLATDYLISRRMKQPWIPAVCLSSPQLFRASGGILSCCP